MRKRTLSTKNNSCSGLVIDSVAGESHLRFDHSKGDICAQILKRTGGTSRPSHRTWSEQPVSSSRLIDSAICDLQVAVLLTTIIPLAPLIRGGAVLAKQQLACTAYRLMKRTEHTSRGFIIIIIIV